MNEKETIAIILARGGSKGIPRKNIIDLCGKPLISYTIEKALEVSRIRSMDVLVSTDDKEIKAVAEKYGAWCPFLRPKELAEDNVESYPVVKHALKEAELINKKEYKYIVYLQPTSPLWETKDLISCLDILYKKSFNSVVAVTEVDTHPFRMKRIISGGNLINYIDQGFEDMRPRQSLPKVFKRAGSLYVSRRSTILNENTLVSENCFGYEVPQHTAVDIDTQTDLTTVRSILEGC